MLRETGMTHLAILKVCQEYVSAIAACSFYQCGVGASFRGGRILEFQVQVEFTHELFLFGNELVFGIFEYLNLAQHFATTESSSFVTYPHLLNKIIANYQ